MQNGDIVYNYEGMTELAGRITKCEQDFEDIQTEMDGIVASLIEAVRGEVQTSYESGHASVRRQYEEVQEDARDLASKLTSAASSMQEADAAAGARVRSQF